MGIADIHIHTLYSYDGTAPVAATLQRARDIGLDVIAITDHDEIRGSLIACDLAPRYGIEVIPGLEVTTAEGDLLALFVSERIPAGLSLRETLLRVGELGGVAVAPHPMAGGFSMKSLSAYAIRQATNDPATRPILLGVETYNATALDRESNVRADHLARWVGAARTGSSDAHVIEAIGAGRTEFPGKTAADLRASLWMGTTRPVLAHSWSATRILGSWLAGYLKSAPLRWSASLG